jgi:outer membrane protein assembly factor BamB
MKKMKNILNKNIAITLAIFLMSTIAIPLFAILPSANAHDPPWQIPTFAYITAHPNPVGVGQSVSVVMFLSFPIPGSAEDNDIRFHDYKLTITAPDGNIETKIWPVVSDTTAVQFYSYTPEQTGKYTFTFDYPGQKHTWNTAYQNDEYLASNATTTLTVQEEPIPDPPNYPLPTEYWSRPIEGQNTEWYDISSNYLRKITNYGSSPLFQPDGAAPNSAHIMWSKPFEAGGVVGGTGSKEPGMTFYSGTHYEMKFMDAMIMNGKLYYSQPQSNNAYGGGYVCVDLRTGQEEWWQNYTSTTARPSGGQLLAFDSPNQHGVIPNGYLWTSNYQNAYDPLTGNWLFSYTGVPSGTELLGPNGEILRYVLDANNKWLALWNSTVALGNYQGTGYGMYSWRPVGKTIDTSTSYSWNVTLPSAIPSGSTIRAIIQDDIMLGSNTTFTETYTAQGFGTQDPWTMWAISLKPGSRGDLLWIKNYAAPANNVTLNFPAFRCPLDPVNRVFIMFSKEDPSYTGYSIDDGSLMWGPTPPEDPWNIFLHGGTGGAHNAIAYGKLYSTGYSGVVYCYDTKDGKLLWNYSAPSGYNTPYPGYPLQIYGVADDKVYLSTEEHSANAPYWKGSKTRCINATTGDELWTIDGTHANTMPIADGYLVTLNLYDMQLYCIGKGPSSTSVSIQNDVTPLGNTVLIKGSVTDTSAGTLQHEQAARFPNGVPAVSDESMSPWMEYVYMQKPKPTNTTGVLVNLYVLDPNNNYRPIGEAISDDNGFYSCIWEPDIPGKYTVIAKFEGTESYWPSQAVSAFAVSEHAPTTPPAPENMPSVADLYFVPAIAGLFVAIIVVGALLAVLLLKKRP